MNLSYIKLNISKLVDPKPVIIRTFFYNYDSSFFNITTSNNITIHFIYVLIVYCKNVHTMLTLSSHVYQPKIHFKWYL